MFEDQRGSNLGFMFAAVCACLVACGGSANDPSKPDGGNSEIVCKPTRPTSCPSPPLRYPDVQPIFQLRCVHCHYDGADQWPLTTYQHVADWFDVIPGQILTCQMPPSDAGIPMTNEERGRILTWIQCGFPQ